MLEIDGSFGEAGGQILRTALSLSCLLRKPFRMFNIRKGRKKPGLMPQHLTCAHALALISSAMVGGDAIGSTELVFEPGDPKPGDYFFDIGTAGSTSLLLQAILPPLIFAKEGSRVTLTGGTHVPFSPPYQFISDIFAPMLSRLGIRVQTSIVNYGFYPKGGGKITAEVSPSGKLEALSLIDRGEIKKVRGISAVSSLPMSIADRQRKAALRLLEQNKIAAEIETLQVTSYSPGTFVYLQSMAGGCIAGFSSLGERGKKAETVGEEAAGEFLSYYDSSACLDHHLADQIVPYLAALKGESSFSTSRITDHLLTNLWVIEKFLGIKYSVEGEKGNPGRVAIIP
jgi:RNA 3'-terminal phosphate cyclase (ATP)